MDNEFWHKVLKVIVILALGALGIYILLSAFPAMMESHLIFDSVALLLLIPIALIIIGIIRSWK
jgi:hypothetical protein